MGNAFGEFLGGITEGLQKGAEELNKKKDQFIKEVTGSKTAEGLASDTKRNVDAAAGAVGQIVGTGADKVALDQDQIKEIQQTLLGKTGRAADGVAGSGTKRDLNNYIAANHLPPVEYTPGNGITVTKDFLAEVEKAGKDLSFYSADAAGAAGDIISRGWNKVTGKGNGQTP